MNQLAKSLLLAFFLLPLLSSAQNRKVFHETFEIDSVKVIYFDILDSLIVEHWAGDVVLSETKIRVLNASRGILNHLVENGRYSVETKLTQDTFSMVSTNRERQQMNTPDGRIMAEEVFIRVFIPEDYIMLEPHIWVLPKEEEEEKEKNQAPKPQNPDNKQN